MPYSEKLVDRLRIALMDIPKVEEKKMFRGVTFMVDDKMCICVSGFNLMCRVDPEVHDQLLEEKPCRSMVMKGREYKGYILVNEEDVAKKAELDFWVRQCLDFNGRAKSSKKKSVKNGPAARKTASTARKTASTARKTPAAKKTSPKKKTAPARKPAKASKPSSAKRK